MYIWKCHKKYLDQLFSIWKFGDTFETASWYEPITKIIMSAQSIVPQMVEHAENKYNLNLSRISSVNLCD